jgi:pyroglutamyl-peptidase
MRVLVTGFEPFGDVTVNTSEQVLAPLAAAAPRGCEVETLLLPVSWERSFETLRAVLERDPPDVVLLLGVHAGLDRLLFERQAHKWMKSENPDNDGVVCTGRPIHDDGRPAYFARAPVQELVGASWDVGTPARVSDDAGAYLCNATYYRTLHHCAEHDLASRVVFVHLPLLPEHAEGRPSLPQDAIVAGLAAALASLKAAAQ